MFARIARFTSPCTRGCIHRNFSVRANGSLEDVVILGYARTPVGSFLKSLAPISAPALGSIAIKGAVEHAKIDPNAVQDCFMGLVVSSNSKQAPAKQAALNGGLNISTPCTTVNKLCASGMKTIMFGAQSIALGQQDVVCAGGMESMSNTPFFVLRQMPPYGGGKLLDSLIFDGLTDAKYGFHMGRCAEKTAADMKISRADQDAFAEMSYKRSQAAAASGVFKSAIIPVRIPNKKAPNGYDEVTEDEEYMRADFARFPKLKPAFLTPEEGGTVTAANASSINDGGAAVIMSSAKYAAKDSSLKPIARIIAYADAAVDTIDFPIAPHLAVEKIFKYTGLKAEDIALWEINEAFAIVALANMRLLGLDTHNVNIHGGAVSCGHPIGMSGTRITGHLALQLKPGQKGIACICNGGGGAAAILIEGL